MSDLADKIFRRILIIKPSSPGDIIHALPVLRALRRQYPNAHIAWLVATSFANLLEADPALNEIIPFDRKRFAHIGRSLSVTRDFLAFLRELRRKNFDLVLDLQGLFRSGFLARASGAPTRIGFRDARELAWLFYNRTVHRLPKDMHAADKNMLALELLEIRAPWRKPGVERETAIDFDSKYPSREYSQSRLPGATALKQCESEQNSKPISNSIPPEDFRIALTDDDRCFATRLLENAGIASDQPYAVLVPATRWETKCWPADRFGKLAHAIYQEYKIPSILVGGTSDIDVGQHAVAASNGAAHNLCGKTTLRQLAALIDRAAITITADSTPMHMAAAGDRPLVALFGPTNPARTGPHGRESDVLRLDLKCSPCYLRKLSQCPFNHACMQDLSVEMVTAVIRQRLNP